MTKPSSLLDLSVADFLERLASGAPTPGGGSAAALAGALAASLSSMVCHLTLGKPEFADVAQEVERLLGESEAARAALGFGIEADAAAFARVAAAYKLPRGTEAERQARALSIQRASRDAAREPLEAARLCARQLDICERLAEVGNPRLLSDVVVAAHLARAALDAAAANVEVNLGVLADDPFAAEARAELRRLREGRDAQVAAILARVRQRTA